MSKRVAKKKSQIGILVCGSGTGMAITANKSKAIRAALAIFKSILSHPANILCLGSRLTKKNNIKKIVSIFLKTKFEGGRHKRRIKKI